MGRAKDWAPGSRTSWTHPIYRIWTFKTLKYTAAAKRICVKIISLKCILFEYLASRCFTLKFFPYKSLPRGNVLMCFFCVFYVSCLGSLGSFHQMSCLWNVRHKISVFFYNLNLNLFLKYKLFLEEYVYRMFLLQMYR